MIVATVGRVVWFYPQINVGVEPPSQPYAALIAFVHSDTCVNLAIFDSNGVPWQKPPTSITLVQDAADTPASGHYCTWMPFQKGQAAKTEAAEKALAEK